jgi:hypothetical protein
MGSYLPIRRVGATCLPERTRGITPSCGVLLSFQPRFLRFAPVSDLRHSDVKMLTGLVTVRELYGTVPSSTTELAVEAMNPVN